MGSSSSEPWPSGGERHGSNAHSAHFGSLVSWPGYRFCTCKERSRIRSGESLPLERNGVATLPLTLGPLFYNTSGIDCVAVEPLGKRVRTLAYWIGLAFDSTITVLTILGAKRSGVRPVHLLPRRRSNSSSSFKSASHQAFLRQTRLPRRIVLDQLLYYAVVLGTGLAAVITGVLPDNNVGPFTKILFVPLQLTLACVPIVPLFPSPTYSPLEPTLENAAHVSPFRFAPNSPSPPSSSHIISNHSSISTCRIVLNLRELMADRRPPANPPAVPFARSLPFSPSPLSPPTAISPSPLSRAHIPIHLESESLWLSTRPRQTSSLDSRPHSHSHSHQPQPQSQLSPSLADATQPTTQPLPLPCSSTTGRHHLDFNFDSDVDVPATASCPNTRNRTHNRTGTCTHTQTRASDHQRPFSSWSGSGTSNGSSGSVSGSGSVGVGVGVGVPQDGGPSPSPTKTRTGKPEPAADEESVYTNPDERKDEHGRRHEHEHEQDLGSDGHAHAHAHGNGNGISGVKMIKETCVQISGPGP